MTDPTPPVSPAPVAETSGGQFLLLILRFIVGYGVLFVCALMLLRRPPWTLSAVDAVFWIALVAVVVMHRATSRTAIERAQWRSAAMWHVGVGSAIWLGGQSVHAIP